MHICDEVIIIISFGEFVFFLIYKFWAAVLNFEEDVAAYTIRASVDPRVCNRVIIYRPPGNIVSQLDLVSSWEKKTGTKLQRTHIPEQDIIELSEGKLKLPITSLSRLGGTNGYENG